MFIVLCSLHILEYLAFHWYSVICPSKNSLRHRETQRHRRKNKNPFWLYESFEVGQPIPNKCVCWLQHSKWNWSIYHWFQLLIYRLIFHGLWFYFICVFFCFVFFFFSTDIVWILNMYVVDMEILNANSAQIWLTNMHTKQCLVNTQCLQNFIEYIKIS